MDRVITITDDWNQADTYIAFGDFVTSIPPTRGDELLNIIFMNDMRLVADVLVCPPLGPYLGKLGRPSDHNIVHISLDLSQLKLNGNGRSVLTANT